MSTGASRAWLGVALIGLAFAALLLAAALPSRLGAGQDLVGAAGPAFADERVAGTKAGVAVLSQYVDVVDPLLTARGGARRDAEALVRLLRRRLGVTSAQARKILRREAPHVEALTRALPLESIAVEVPRVTSYLAAKLTMSEEQLAGTLERDFPRISQTLTALPTVADAWYDVPGIEGLTRVSRDKPVRTVPGLRKYLRDDLTPRIVDNRENVQDLAGRGGVRYLAYLLLLVAIAVVVYGLAQARSAVEQPPGKRSWWYVVGAGVLLLALVLLTNLVPRLNGGRELVSELEPVFTPPRVTATANGLDSVHQAVALGDPLMTPAGGASREAPRLYRFVARRTGRTSRDVKRAIEARAPHTVALLDAIPLTQVAGEVPGLVRYLARALRISQDEVRALLRRRAPALAQALLTLPSLTDRWNEIPGAQGMTRFDGVTPVRSVPELDDYLRQDLRPVLVREREHFEKLSGGWLALDAVAPVVIVAGLLLGLYGGVMMQFVAGRD